MWALKNKSLYKKFVFNNFSEAIAFIVRVSLVAEKKNHHPRLLNSYNVVEIWLSTHEAGSVVTKKDEQLAKAIDAIF
jgi:4a-hydroxytetrahydrobiopterin dehydratase